MNEKIEIEQDEPTRPGTLPDFIQLFERLDYMLEALDRLSRAMDDATEMLKKWKQDNSIELIEGENEQNEQTVNDER